MSTSRSSATLSPGGRSATAYLRAEIAALSPYVPGRQPTERIVKLNANENPYPPAPGVMVALQALDTEGLRLYPDATAQRVRETAAEVYGVAPDEVIVGNGSDEILTMIVRVFLAAGDRISVVDPTYTLYEILAAMQGARTDRYPLDDEYRLTSAFMTAHARVTFLPNPNAQTGTLFTADALNALCAQRDGVVVIDEAYGPFAGVNALPLLRRHGNLIVLRTLSKTHGLAGLRIGLGFARSDVIAALMKVKDSYNLNAASQAAAIAALRDGTYTEAVIAKLVQTRERFAAALVDRGWRVVPSAANFVLATPPQGSAEELLKRLECEGYLVRRFDTPRLRDKLRFSMGTMEQMDALLAVLDRLCDRQTCRTHRATEAG